MKKVRKSLAIIFALAMLFTNGTVQYAFAEDDIAVPETEKDIATYVYRHDATHPYQYRSPHRYSYEYKGTKSKGPAPAIYRMLKTDDSNSVNLGYCCDLRTSVKAGTYYKRVNLEDAGYYSTGNAKHIRLILKKGYWREAGKSATATNLSGLASDAAKANNLDNNQTALLNNLTSAEALAATQYAIWHYANQDDGIRDNDTGIINNFVKYVFSQHANLSGDVADPSSVNVTDGLPNNPGKGEYTRLNSKTRIEWVYNYLIGLNPNDAAYSNLVQPVSVISGFDQEYSNIQVVPNATDEEGTVTYNVNVTFKLNGSLDDKNDQLQVVAKPVMKKDSKSTVGAQSITLNSTTKSEDGSYTVTFADLTAAQVKAIDKIEFTLAGEQYVANEVYFYEPFGGRDAAQSFVGFGSGKTKVHQTWTMNISDSETNQIEEKNIELIKYDEDSAVKAEDAKHAEELETAGMVKVSDEGNGTYIDKEKVITLVGAKFQLYAKVDGSDKEILVGEPVITDDNGKASWTILASGNDVTYYCKEIEAPIGYKLPDGNVTYDLTSSEARVYVPNCHDTGSIIISKTVEGNAGNSSIDTTQHFNFKVEVDFSEATLVKECKKSEIDKNINNYSTVWSGSTKECGETSHKDVTWTQGIDKDGNKADGKWTTNITLAHGESLEIKDLPVGTKCTVTELDADGNAIKDSSKPFIYNDILYVTANTVQSINVQSGEYTLDDKETTDVDESKNVIGFVNTKYADQGQITLTKEFIGEAADGTYYFRLFNKDGQVTDAFHGRQMVREIKVKDGKVINKAVFTGVPFGEYTVYEVDKDGKKLDKSEVDDNGDGNIVTLNGTKYVVNGEGAVSVSQNSPNAALTITNTSLTITKTDITGTDEVAGAKLKITEKPDGTSEEEKEIDEWTSTKESHVVKGKLEKGKTYVITEVTAPEGYAYITTDIEFTIDNDGKIQIIGENKNAELSKDTAGNTTGILVKDDAISFTVNKTDLDGNELAGSEITIFKYNNETGEIGDVVGDPWISKVGVTYDLGSKLTAGETYLLRETNAPDGYGYIDDVIFTVAKDGSIEFIKNSLPTMKSEADDSVKVMDLDNEVSNITNNNSNDSIYLVKDGQTEVIVKKLDQHKNPVVGAKLAILDENGEPVLTNDGTAIEWTTDGKDKDITGLLIAGKTYTLTELEAPEGYQKAEDIEFTVPEPNGESKTVTMTDVKFGMGGVDKDGNGNNNGSNNDNSISTGDRTNMGLCLMLMTAAMAAGLGALTFRRKA